MDPIETRQEVRQETVETQAPGGTGVSSRVETTRISSNPQTANRVVELVIGVIDLILAVNFVFVLAGAAATGFVLFIGDIAGALSAPFAGIFPAYTAGVGHPFAWADVVAIVVWTICAGIVVKLISIASNSKTAQSVNQ